MNLLVLSQYYWPENFGITTLTRSISTRGVKISILTGQPNYPDGVIYKGYSALGICAEHFEGLEIFRVPLIPRGHKSSLMLAINYLSFIVSATLIAPWLLRGRRFDAILVYAPSPLLQAIPAIFLAWIKQAPLAVWVQDLWPESLSATGFVKNRWLLQGVASIVRFIYNKTDCVLIPSEAFRHPIEALSRYPDRIHYYPNAFADNLHQQLGTIPEVAKLLFELRQNFSIVFAGNLGVAQSLETVLGAAEKLRNLRCGIQLFLIGSGSQSEWLKSEVDRRQLSNVTLPGRFQANVMAHIYEASRVLLVSLRDEPIFSQTVPSKIQSYLAAGKPIIASLNGEGARIVTEARAGISCPAGDVEALAGAMINIYEMSDEVRQKMGENGRCYANRYFGLKSLTDELIARLNEMIRKQKR